MTLHKLTEEEQNELNLFKTNDTECAYQILLGMIANDAREFDSGEEVTARELHEAYIKDKKLLPFNCYWLHSLLIEWVNSCAAKNGKRIAIMKAGVCGFALKDVYFHECYTFNTKLSRPLYELYEETAKQLQEDNLNIFANNAECAYSLAISFLEQFGIKRIPKPFKKEVDVSKLPFDFYFR